jgi:hypothetical protein
LANSITIGGTVADQTAVNQESIRPFSAATIEDGNAGATETIPIAVTTLDHVDPSMIHSGDYLFA